MFVDIANAIGTVPDSLLLLSCLLTMDTGAAQPHAHTMRARAWLCAHSCFGTIILPISVGIVPEMSFSDSSLWHECGRAQGRAAQRGAE